jgi:hypothetical protein
MKAIIALALIALTLQACIIEHSEAPLSAMCILILNGNEQGRVLFRQTGCNTPLNIKGIFKLPANVSSVLHIHNYQVLDTCENIGPIFMPKTIQPKGFTIKTDANGDGNISLQSQDYSLRGLSSLVGRSCRITVPFGDRTGVTGTNYACGTIALVSERIANSFGQGGRNLIERERSICSCSPYDLRCHQHRPRWCDEYERY